MTKSVVSNRYVHIFILVWNVIIVIIDAAAMSAHSLLQNMKIMDN